MIPRGPFQTLPFCDSVIPHGVPQLGNASLEAYSSLASLGISEASWKSSETFHELIVSLGSVPVMAVNHMYYLA